MARLKTCICCGEKIGNGEKAIPYKKRYAHEKCFNKAVKSIKKSKDEKIEENITQRKNSKVTKPKVELKDAMSEKDYAEKKQYYNYLRNLLNNELSAKIYALTEDYIKRYQFTFSGMYQTLVYLHEIIQKDLEGDIVGIIPYYYNNAAEYFKSVENVEEANKNIDVSKMYKQKTVFIKPRTKKIKLIDVNSIGQE